MLFKGLVHRFGFSLLLTFIMNAVRLDCAEEAIKAIEEWKPNVSYIIVIHLSMCLTWVFILQTILRATGDVMTAYFNPPLVMTLSGKGTLFRTSDSKDDNYGYTTILLGVKAPPAFKQLVYKMCDEIRYTIDATSDLDPDVAIAFQKYTSLPEVRGAMVRFFLRDCYESECEAAWKKLGVPLKRYAVSCKKAWHTSPDGETLVSWLDGDAPPSCFLQLETVCKINRISFYGDGRFIVWGQQRNGFYHDIPSRVDDSVDDEDLKVLMKK